MRDALRRRIRVKTALRGQKSQEVAQIEQSQSNDCRVAWRLDSGHRCGITQLGRRISETAATGSLRTHLLDPRANFVATHSGRKWPFATGRISMTGRRLRGVADATGPAACSSRTRTTRSDTSHPPLTAWREARRTRGRPCRATAWIAGSGPAMTRTVNAGAPIAATAAFAFLRVQ